MIVKKTIGRITISLCLILFTQCSVSQSNTKVITLGDEQLDLLLPKIKALRVALVVNHTAVVNNKHLADTLKDLGIHIVKIMPPEHGFRGDADAGAHIQNSFDEKLGVPIVALYGKTKKPTAEQLSDVDVVIFDIQDVGVRYFTYVGTLHYVMEACAENNKKLIILDRPNPNGSYIDGPILDTAFRSFVGMHPVPIVHGMTVGEYAQMINGEQWLQHGITCDLEIIPVKNWKRTDPFVPPIKPSPNLPNIQAIRLYPSTCLFEGTVLSLGRGTPDPFQVIGHPKLTNMPYSFTPVSTPGMALHPVLENQVCYGIDLRQADIEQGINLDYLFLLYHAYPKKDEFFKPFFNTLAGSEQLQNQIKQGLTQAEIKATWKQGLESFRRKREQYLLYE